MKPGIMQGWAAASHADMRVTLTGLPRTQRVQGLSFDLLGDISLMKIGIYFENIATISEKIFQPIFQVCEQI